jgi:Protein of unknown function (DUF1559)
MSCLIRGSALTVLLLGGSFVTVPLFGHFSFSAALQKTPQISEEEARKMALDRLDRLTRAFHFYFDIHKSFPPAILANKEGKALLSWRVLLLPYLGEEKLFGEFKLVEPWDSPTNSKLLARMPKVFALPLGDGAEPNATPWQVFHGPGALFEGTKGRGFQEITDGSSNTILVVEAAVLVPWTKPQDLPFDVKKDLPKLGFMFPEVFLFALADGSVHQGTRKFDVAAMRAAITRNGSDLADFEKIWAKK